MIRDLTSTLPVCQCTWCNGLDSNVPVGSICLCSNCHRKSYCVNFNECLDDEGNKMELEEE